MRKSFKKVSLFLAAVMLTTSLAACGGDKDDKKTADFSGMSFTVGAYRDLRTDPYNNSYGIGADKFVEKYKGAKVDFVIHKNGEELVTAVSSGDVWDVQLAIMSPSVAAFRQDVYEPLDKYIDMNNPIYTKKLIEDTSVLDGKTYGVTNVIMSDVYYMIYNQNMYEDFGIKTPYDYYKDGQWTWDNMLKMIDDLKKNQLNTNFGWMKPSLSRLYGFTWNSDYTVNYNYDSQQQRDWLNFIRTIVYDKGMVNTKGETANREVAIKLDILPHILVNAKKSNTVDTMRYIPLASKDGKPNGTYVVDYSFSVPKGAKSIEGSVELSNEMIKACIDDRTTMYKEGMTEDDYKIFADRIQNFARVRDIENFYYSEKDLITEFTQGKSVSQHISEVDGKFRAAVDAHNKKVADRKNGITTSPSVAPAK